MVPVGEAMRKRRASTTTPLALAVLYMLRERSMHTYELHRLFHDRGTDRVVKVRAGSLYHVVDRLHGAELIRPESIGQAGKHPRHTVFAITDAGRRALRRGLHALLRDPAEEYPSFAAAVHMLTALDPAEAVVLLRERTTTLITEGDGEAIDASYARAMRRAEHEWITALLARIESGGITRAPGGQPDT
jgi:DNA-binding PadR family transcriptional regulator